MQLESRVENLLNPCKFGDNIRQGSYITATPSSLGAGGTALIRMNNNETADLSNSYLEFDITLINSIAEVPLNFTLASGAAAVSGYWYLTFQGRSLGDFAVAATSTQVVSGLNNFPLFYSQGFVAALHAGQTGAETISTGMSIDISTNGYYGAPVQYSDFMAVSGLLSAGGADIVAIHQATAYVAPTPRLEKTLPIIRQIIVNFGSENVINISNNNKLMAALSFLDSELDTQGKYLETPYQEHGLYTAQMRCRLDLSYIDLFNSVIPLELLGNRELQINIQFEDANKVLICSNATNSANQSYNVNNVRIQYHKLILTSDDKAAINSVLSSPRGLVIPFKNWGNYVETYASGQSTLRAQFNPQKKHLLGVYFTMLDTSYASDATNTRKITTFLRNNVQRFRLEVGTIYYPLNHIETGNTYLSVTEHIRNLVEFTEIVKEKRLWCDMEAFSNFTGVGYQGSNPNDIRYVPYFNAPVNMNCIFGISSTDIPYSDKSSLCGRKVLEGADSSSISNVAIVIDGMNPVAAGELHIFAYSQEFLHFSNGQMRWIK